jgi:hypothetical protein
MRKRTDRLYVRTLGPREREALALVEQRPGIIVAELADALGVSVRRLGQISAASNSGGCGVVQLDRASTVTQY